MIKATGTIKSPSIEKIVKSLKEDIYNIVVLEEKDIAIIADEEYYFRIGSFLMSVLTLRKTGRNSIQYILTVGGAKEGLLGFSLSAEDDKAFKELKDLEKICKENNWTMTEPIAEEIDA
jgi:hypothetical protein